MAFTAIDLIRDLDYAPEPPLTWEVGAAVRDAYRQAHRALPPKALRPKTAGAGGSHCMAVYPDEFRSVAEAVVKRTIDASAAATRAQRRLFDGGQS